jgi:hypothetical protein
MKNILFFILDVHIPIQSKILSYIPNVKTIFLMSLKKEVKYEIQELEKKIAIKRKYLETYKETIYNSCLHENYTKEHWNDGYHHNYTKKRCDLCKMELNWEDGKNETGFINCDW